MIDAIQTEDSDDLVETFHKTLEEHLQFQEGHLKKTLEKTKEEEISAFKTEKDVKYS